MCGRYALYGPISMSRADRAAAASLGLDLERALNSREPQYNIAPTQQAPVIAMSDGVATVKAIRWGLVPTWAKDISIGARAITARAETVADKPMFRTAFKTRRCLVPASGYFEWTGTKGSKQPYLIHDPDHTLLMFAGLWEVWRPSNDGEWLRTYTIITGAPGKVSGDIHDRQPVILPPESWPDWLGAGAPVAQDILQRAVGTEAPLTYYPVSRAVGNVRNDGRDLVEPIAL